MPPDWVRVIFLFIWLFIQALWIITTHGANVINFFRTFINIRSTSIVLFEIICFFQVLLPINTSISFGFWNSSLEIFSIVLALAGTALASWAKLVMGKSWGRPAQHDKSKQSSLVTTGPFAYTRNPIYVGLFLLFVGQQIALRSFFLLLSPLFFLVIQNAIATEEKLLYQYFGKAYLAYQSRIPRFL